MNRGDFFHVDLNPIRGREQAGARYVFVVSPKIFNKLGTSLICPIILGGGLARDIGFAVSLQGTGGIVQGVVLCNQARTVDLTARSAKFVEKAPAYIVDEVLAKIQTLLD